MSESGGSDDAGEDGESGIDKEALREELREKYERDERERESTRRMSDLLLKGATMTNAHCGTCGDPLFQQNGTTFCPGCHGGPEGVEGPDLEGGSDADGDSAPTAAAGDHPGRGGGAGTAAPGSDATGPDDSASETARDAGTELQPDTLPETGSSTDGRDLEPAGAAGDADGQDPSIDSGRTGSDGRRPDDLPTPSGEPSAPAPGRRTDDRLAGARENLEHALEKFAAEAAATDDPRYARDCLEAASEASEALDSLR